MEEQEFEEELIRRIVKIMWDEKPRTNFELAEELQMRWPSDYFTLNIDLLAQHVYAKVTGRSVALGMMTSPLPGKYKIRKEFTDER